MKRLNTFFLCFIILVFFACSNDKGNFKISNASNFDVEDLSITPDSKKQLIDISKGENKELNTSMNEVNQDGSYLLSFKNSETKEIINYPFGYFSNGNQIEKYITIKIENYTILIDSNFNNIY